MNQPSKKLLDELTYEVIGAAIEVHRALGPGLLEKVYHNCMKIALTKRGVFFQTELAVPVLFLGEPVSADLKCDLFIERILPIEMKAVKEILPIHEAQLMTSMRLLQVPKGVLLNFTCTHLFKEGQKTFVNRLYGQLPDA